jgi:hypothetical protein
VVRANHFNLERSFLTLAGFLLLSLLPGKGLAFLPGPWDRPDSLDSLLFLGTLREPSVVRPELVSSDHPKLWLWKDRSSGSNRLIEFKDPPILLNSFSESSLGEASKAVLNFIDKNFELLKISSENLKLNPEASIFNGHHQFLKYNVYLNGLLIKDANLDVRLFQGKVLQIVNESFSEAQLSPSMFTEREAHKAVKAILDRPFQSLASYYRVSLRSDGYHLTPTHLLKSYPSPDSSFDIEFDLRSGQLTEVSSDKFSAKIPVAIKGFDRDTKAGLFTIPYARGMLKWGNTGMSQFTSATGEIEEGSYRFDGLSNNVAMIVSSDWNYRLNTLAARDIDLNGKSILTFPSHFMKTTPENDPFYAHGTVFRTLTLLRNMVNDIDGALSSWVDSPIKAFVNEDSECNAYYVRRDAKDLKSGTINFLQGKNACNNTGNMADVVAHEWGHGLDDSTGGIEDRAFSEGFGDTVAYAVFFRPDIGTNLMRDGKPIRDISEFKSYPNDRGEPHQEGLIIANTFYDLYQKLLKSEPEVQAKKHFRSYVFQMIKGARKYTNVHDFLMAFERDTTRRCLINKVFIAHGLGKVREDCP